MYIINTGVSTVIAIIGSIVVISLLPVLVAVITTTALQAYNRSKSTCASIVGVGINAVIIAS